MTAKNLMEKVKFFLKSKLYEVETNAEKMPIDVYVIIDDDEELYDIKGISIDDDNDLIIHANKL